MNFEAFLQQKGIIPKTIARHEREINKYETWLNLKKGRTPENATKKDLLDYLQHIKQSRKICNATQNSVLQKLKNYYAYLAKEHGINDITHFIKIRGVERRHLRPIFSPEELDLLCDAYYFYTKEYKPSRNELYFYPDYSQLLQGRYIALTLVAYQGLKISEILSLDVSSFDFRKATVTVRESRRGTARTLALEASQIGVLIQYFSNTEDTPIMPNLNHFEHLSNTLKPLMSKYQDFRQLRTSKITHWLKLHGLRKAQHLAGHKNISATEKYLAGDFETLQNDLNNFHPLN